MEKEKIIKFEQNKNKAEMEIMKEKEIEKLIFEKKEEFKEFFEGYVHGVGMYLGIAFSDYVLYNFLGNGKFYHNDIKTVLNESFINKNFKFLEKSSGYDFCEGNENGNVYQSFKKNVMLNVISKEFRSATMENDFEEEMKLKKRIEKIISKDLKWFYEIFENKELQYPVFNLYFDTFDFYYEEGKVIFWNPYKGNIKIEKGFTEEKFYKKIKTDEFEKEILKLEEINSLSYKEKVEFKSLCLNAMEKFGENVELKTVIEVSFGLFNENKIEGQTISLDVSSSLCDLYSNVDKNKDIKESVDHVKYKKEIENYNALKKDILHFSEDVAVKAESEQLILIIDGAKKFKLKNLQQLKKIISIMNEIKAFENEVITFEKIVDGKISCNFLYKIEGIRKVIKRDFVILNDEIIYNGYKKKMDEKDICAFIKFKYSEIKKRLLQSRKNAKEFFYSNLTLEEEEQFKKEKFLELKVGKYIYLLKGKESLNIINSGIYKYEKDNFYETIKYLCIKPDRNVDVYDFFGSLVMELKAGENEYIEKNSNKFNVSDKIKKELLDKKIRTTKIEDNKSISKVRA